MTTLGWTGFVMVLLLTVVLMYARHLRNKFRRLNPRKELIKVPMMKIFHNPFLDKPMWTQFNPQSRTWEWYIDALPDEVEKHIGIAFTLEKGLAILNQRTPKDQHWGGEND